MEYLRISIIIPTYNTISYIEETLKSIINQDYPNLEIIVLDSCSSDGTTELLKRYFNKIAILIVEKDQGQYFAIRRGFELATGEIIAWINGDDKYFPWTFSFVNEIFTNYTNVMWIGGLPSFMNEKGKIYGLNYTVPSRPIKYIQNGWFTDNKFGYLQQEGMFWRRSIYDEAGGINLAYKLAADFDLWIKFAQISELVSVGIPLACFRVHENSRSKILKFEYETEVGIISKDKHKLPFILQLLLRSNPILNAIIRKLIWKKSLIYYFSLKNKSWKLDSKITSISAHPLSHMALK